MYIWKHLVKWKKNPSTSFTHKKLHENHLCHRADSRFAPSQWETSLQSKAVSHWLGVNLESTLSYCPGVLVNTLRPRLSESNFVDDIFKCIFLNEIPIEMSLKFVPKGPTNNIPALVQIMAWRRPGDKPLSEPMMISLLMHICVTRPQWVNPSSAGPAYSRPKIGHHCACRYPGSVRSINRHSTDYNGLFSMNMQ